MDQEGKQPDRAAVEDHELTQPVISPLSIHAPYQPPKASNTSRTVIAFISGAAFMLVGVLAVLYILRWSTPNKSTTTAPKITTQSVKSASVPSTVQTASTTGLQLDPNKNYGNKYANGILPVGDGKYVTSAAKVGYVYACSTYAKNITSEQGGATVRGPWFINNNTQYDINKKVHVKGSIMWQASFSNTLSGSTRTIITNDLPTHPTGTFPIGMSDPAYTYDRNPNKIASQALTYVLTSNPSYSTPTCMGGESGIMLTGIAIFNGFDAGGRDAGAWEIQDSCSGHPQIENEYHYHTLSSCITDTSVATVIGFALDGYPITGSKVGTNNVLTTSDLDECHGITSQVTLDGKKVTTYHYVMTQDFPYSVSCFRAKPIDPPGNHDTVTKPQQSLPIR